MTKPNTWRDNRAAVETRINVVDQHDHKHLFIGDSTMKFFTDGVVCRVYNSAGTIGSFCNYTSVKYGD
jgi:hypothetical protein